MQIFITISGFIITILLLRTTISQLMQLRRLQLSCLSMQDLSRVRLVLPVLMHICSSQGILVPSTTTQLQSLTFAFLSCSTMTRMHVLHATLCPRFTPR